MFRVVHETPLGRETQYITETTTTEVQVSTQIAADGTSTATRRSPDGTMLKDLPDGTRLTLVAKSDPSLGAFAPLPFRTSVETPNGLVSTRDYSRVSSIDPMTGSIESQLDTIDLNGDVSTVLYNGAIRQRVSTSPSGRSVREDLDLRGRVIETQPSGFEAVRFTYHPNGKLASRSQGTGAMERTTAFTYDAQGNLTTVIDPIGRSTTYFFDVAGRVTHETFAGRTIAYTYDSNGNLASLTPPGRSAHVFHTNSLDQEDEYAPPVIGAVDSRVLFHYDSDRSLTEIVRPDGDDVAIGYDLAGRLTTLTTDRGTTTLSYDPSTGNLSTLSAPDGEGLAFVYDGRLLTTVTWSGTINGSIGQVYDGGLRVIGQTINGSASIAFVYDPDGLLLQAGDLQLARDPQSGAVIGTSLDSVDTDRSYSGFGELESDAALVTNAPLYSNSYTRDRTGRITRKVETIQGTTTILDYDYDAVGRLIEVKSDGAVRATYAYDANGNRTGQTILGVTTAGAFDAQDRLEEFGETTYTVDPAGDLNSRTEPGVGTTAYTYDAFGSLVRVELADGRVVEYVIDGQGRRIGKKVDGVLVRGWLYQSQLRPVAELDGSGAVVSRYIYGSRPNVPDYMVRGGTKYRILSDHLGSPRLVVDAATGTVVQRIDYDEFGRVLQDSAPGFQPFGFGGGLYDSDTQLVRLGARDYDPAVGRWTTRDPVRFAGGDPNLYAYALSDPINLSDPSGFSPFDNFVDCFEQNFAFSFKTTNNVFFGGPFRRTAFGAITAGAVAAESGGVTLAQAASAFARYGIGGLPTLGTGGTLAAAAINTGLNALVTAASLEAGIVVGSAADALGQTLAGNGCRCRRW
jgi:RHS repeat-associated protein